MTPVLPLAFLQIPAGTQPNDTQRLRNRGIKRLSSSGHGNQYVHFKLTIPKYDTTLAPLHLPLEPN